MDLTEKDFRILDNNKVQRIEGFDMGGAPLSVAIVLETSSRIEALLPRIRRTGVLFTQTVLGESDDAAVIGYNDQVDRLLDFTGDHDAIDKTVSSPIPGTPQTPTTEELRAGNADIGAPILWVAKHAIGTVRSHPLEIAATATGGLFQATFYGWSAVACSRASAKHVTSAGRKPEGSPSLGTV